LKRLYPLNTSIIGDFEDWRAIHYATENAEKIAIEQSKSLVKLREKQNEISKKYFERHPVSELINVGVKYLGTGKFADSNDVILKVKDLGRVFNLRVALITNEKLRKIGFNIDMFDGVFPNIPDDISNEEIEYEKIRTYLIEKLLEHYNFEGRYSILNFTTTEKALIELHRLRIIEMINHPNYRSDTVDIRMFSTYEKVDYWIKLQKQLAIETELQKHPIFKKTLRTTDMFKTIDALWYEKKRCDGIGLVIARIHEFIKTEKAKLVVEPKCVCSTFIETGETEQEIIVIKKGYLLDDNGDLSVDLPGVFSDNYYDASSNDVIKKIEKAENELVVFDYNTNIEIIKNLGRYYGVHI
jgi:hypothetical protein